MKKLFSVILLSVCMLSVNAQDIIIKKNGDEIKAKVLEVNSSDIKYKKSDNLEGPTYTISKSEVFMIKYANGTKEVINTADTPKTYDAKKLMYNENKLFQEKKSYVSFGYGFGTFIELTNNIWNYNYYSPKSGGDESLTGPLYFKYEYGAGDDFGIGINLAYMQYHYRYVNDNWSSGTPAPYIEDGTYTSFSGLLRANWHFGNSDVIDPYYGIGAGYRSGTWKITDPYQQYDYAGYKANFPFGFETTFGIRIKFYKRMSAYAEAGIAKSAVQFGLTGKF